MKTKVFIWLWLIALLPRLLLALVYLRLPIALDDMFQYDMLARSILRGDGYRWYNQADVEVMRPYLSQFINLDELNLPPEGLETTFRAPGYPLFLALIYAAVPSEARIAVTRIVQALFTALLSPLVYLLAMRISPNPRAALLAALGMAFYPILLMYPLGLASENLFIPLVVMAMLALFITRERPSIPKALLCGLLLGGAMLTRSAIALFVPFAALWLAWGRPDRRLHAGLVLLTAFGLCLPWAMRNTRLMGKPTFVETSMGYNLFVGYHPEGNGSFVSEVAILPLTILDDAERDNMTLQATRKFIRQNPGEAVLRFFRRAAYYFGVEDRELTYFYGNGFFGYIPQPWLSLLYLMLITPWILLLIFTPIGMLSTYQAANTHLVIGLVIAHSLPHLLILAEPRFHLTLVPILLPFAALGWTERRLTIRRLLSPQGFPQMVRVVVLLVWLILAGLLIWNFALHWEKLLAILGPEGHKLHPSY
jgi:4-amino-4-deoxy-L-arabinose transferase-like glycosyltransferase